MNSTKATWMAMIGLRESALMLDPENAFALFPHFNRKSRIRSYLLDRELSKIAHSKPYFDVLLNMKSEIKNVKKIV